MRKGGEISAKEKKAKAQGRVSTFSSDNEWTYLEDLCPGVFIQGHCGEKGPRGRTGKTRSFFIKEGVVLKVSGGEGHIEGDT